MSFLLQENGDAILRESGENILLQFDTAITTVDPETGARGTSFPMVITGTTLDPIESAAFKINQGSIPLGAHGLLFNPTLVVSDGLSAVRSSISAYLLAANLANAELAFGIYNGANVRVMITLRWPDPNDSRLDTPPATDDQDYLDALDAFTEMFNAPNAQTCIADGRLMLGYFNEFANGPGDFWKTDLATSQAQQANAIALINHTIAHLRANVTNGDLIQFCSAAISGAQRAHPDFVPVGDQQTFYVDAIHEWIEWPDTVRATYPGIICAVDVHLNCSGVAVGDRSLVTRLGAVAAYAAFAGVDFTWVSNEFGPAWFRVDGNIPTTTEELDLAASEERAMWAYVFSFTPLHIMRTPYMEQPSNGQSFVWCSIRGGGSLKQPLAGVFFDQFDDFIDDPTITIANFEVISETELNFDVSIAPESGPGLRDILLYGMSAESVVASKADAFTVELGAVPDAPTGLTATALSANRIRLDWSDALIIESGFSTIGHQIERESPIGGGWVVIVENTAVDAETYIDSGLEPETQYNYRVSTINSNGVGLPSNEDDATTLEASTEDPSSIMTLRVG